MLYLVIIDLLSLKILRLSGIQNTISTLKVMWCLVLNIVCCIIGVLQLALGISAANQDFNAMWLRNLKNSTADEKLYNETNAFYEKFFPMTYTIAKSEQLGKVR